MYLFSFLSMIGRIMIGCFSWSLPVTSSPI